MKSGLKLQWFSCVFDSVRQFLISASLEGLLFMKIIYTKFVCNYSFSLVYTEEPQLFFFINSSVFYLLK